jgi:hypothetical protein
MDDPNRTRVPAHGLNLATPPLAAVRRRVILCKTGFRCHTPLSDSPPFSRLFAHSVSRLEPEAVAAPLEAIIAPALHLVGTSGA